MTKVWVTRDKGWSNTDVEFWTKKPTYIGPNVVSSSYEAYEGHFIFRLHTRYFKELFGFTPRKGSCKQYELELKEL